MKYAKLVIFCVVVIAVSALVFVLQKGDTQQNLTVTENVQTTKSEVTGEKLTASEDATTTTEVQEEASDIVAGQKQYVGIHIMADGTVMDGTGAYYRDAEVLQNGDVQMGDGVVIVSPTDLRPKNTPASPQQNMVSFDVVGTDFAYDIKQIKVKKGDTVTINFRSKDGFHDWVLDEFDAATERINEGESDSVTFVADKTGTFQYYCSVMNHRGQGMVGYLVVE